LLVDKIKQGYRLAAYNTAYTRRAYALPFGILLYSVATSYMLETSVKIKKYTMEARR
jgi:hypothetical protein